MISNNFEEKWHVALTIIDNSKFVCSVNDNDKKINRKMQFN